MLGTFKVFPSWKIDFWPIAKNGFESKNFFFVKLVYLISRIFWPGLFLLIFRALHYYFLIRKNTIFLIFFVFLTFRRCRCSLAWSWPPRGYWISEQPQQCDQGQCRGLPSTLMLYGRSRQSQNQTTGWYCSISGFVNPWHSRNPQECIWST